MIGKNILGRLAHLSSSFISARITMASGSQNELSLAKKKLRPTVKGLLMFLSTEEKNRQSEELTRMLIEDPLYHSARTISIYLNMDDEVRTLEIIKHSFRSYKKIYIPQYITHPEPVMKMVELLDMEDLERLPLTKWNIKQPPLEDTHREIATEVDLIVVPGLAFTRQGKRLGRGMGFYDRFMSGLSRRPNTVALAFDVQILEDLPTEGGRDYMVDKVLVCGSPI